MATLNEIYHLRFGCASLKEKVTVAIAKAAVDVLSESETTENHAARLAWARTVLVGGDTQAQADKFMWGVLANAAVQDAGDNATDAQVIAAVGNIINKVIAN